MIFVRLKAGLGNQMFQYALGRSIALRRKVELGLDLSAFANQSPLDTPRAFALQPFRIKAALFQGVEQETPLIERAIQGLKRRMRPEQTFVFNPKVFHAKDGAVLEGYWQSERYFSDYSAVIREDFQLRNEYTSPGKALKFAIAASDAAGEVPVCVHVRRGDYVTNPITHAYHGVCGSGYYSAALESLRGALSTRGENAVPHYFVFSNDVQWSRDNIKPDGRITYVEHDAIVDYERLTLMSHCHHHILSNSTFAWWGAWLNPRLDKIVIAPKRWIAKSSIRTDDIIPPEWLRIDEKLQ